MAIASPLSARWTVAALLTLTTVTGLIDAVSYLRLGRVFVANMAGNVVNRVRNRTGSWARSPRCLPGPASEPRCSHTRRRW